MLIVDFCLSLQTPRSEVAADLKESSDMLLKRARLDADPYHHGLYHVYPEQVFWCESWSQPRVTAFRATWPPLPKEKVAVAAVRDRWDTFTIKCTYLIQTCRDFHISPHNSLDLWLKSKMIYCTEKLIKKKKRNIHMNLAASLQCKDYSSID